jgi:hypothetical protein
MASSGSCFMATWIIFKNHLLEVDLTQNQETTALRTLITSDLLYFFMCKDPHEHKYHWNTIWLRARSHTASHYTRGTMTTLLHGFEGVRFWRPLDTFFWALTISWSQLMAHVWRGPKVSRATEASLESRTFHFSFFNKCRTELITSSLRAIILQPALPRLHSFLGCSLPVFSLFRSLKVERQRRYPEIVS